MIRRLTRHLRIGWCVSAALAAGLAISFATVGELRADRLAGPISAVLALITLLVSLIRKERAVSPSDPDTPPPPALPHMSHSKYVGGNESPTGLVVVGVVALTAIIAATVILAIYWNRPTGLEQTALLPTTPPPPPPSSNRLTTPPPGDPKPSRTPPPTTTVPPTTTAPPAPIADSTVTCPTTDTTVYSCHGLMLLGTAGAPQPQSAFMAEWRVRDERSDLWRDKTGFFTENGGQLAIVDARTALSKRKCSQATTWHNRIDFRRLTSDSQLCMRTGYARYAGIIIRSLPTTRSAAIDIAGYTWK